MKKATVKKVKRSKEHNNVLSQIAKQIVPQKPVQPAPLPDVIDAFVVRTPDGNHIVYDKRVWTWKKVGGKIEVCRKKNS